jgi:hypothetical protein
MAAAYHRMNAFRYSGGPQTVQHFLDLRSKPVDSLDPRHPVVRQEVADLMGNGHSLLIWTVGSVDKDQTVTSLSNDAPADCPALAPEAKTSASPADPLLNFNQAQPRKFHQGNWQSESK